MEFNPDTYLASKDFNPDEYLGAKKSKFELGTAFKSSLAEANNAIEKAVLLPAGGLVSMFSQEQGDKIFKGMDDRAEGRRKLANPEGRELSTAEQFAGMITTLPAQIPAIIGQAATKGTDLIRRGEPLSTAVPATLVDAAVNAVGVGPMAAAKSFMGRAAIGAGSNVAFGAGSDAATQLLATQQETKDAYNPYDVDRRLLDAATGGVFQGAFGEGRGIKAKEANAKVSAIKEAFKEPEKVTPKPLQDIKNLTALENESKQMSLFDIDESVQAGHKYQAEFGDWRVDENGIPIRADLSMEAQFDQSPLQRDMFVDANGSFAKMQDTGYYNKAGDLVETPTKSMQTALDELSWAHKRGALKQSGLLKGEIEASGPLKTAVMEAEGLRFIPQSQRGGINLDVFKPNFENTKTLDNGVILRATGRSGDMLTIQAYKDGARVAGAVFEPKNIGIPASINDAQATMVGSKLEGTASELYKFAAELGNDIVPSEVRTEGGKALWERMKREGIVVGTKKPFIPKGQRGALWMGSGNEGRAAEQYSKIPGIKSRLAAIIPDLEKTTEQVIEEARPTKDIDQNFLQRGLNYLTKGALYQAQKTGNPLVRHTAHTWLNADRQARGKVQEYVHDGLAPAYRNLSKQEAIEVATLLNLSDLKHNAEITPEFLAGLGFSKKQVDAVSIHQAVMDTAFDAINLARASAGKSELDRRTAYASMRATGDYKRLVYQLDEDGEKTVVGVVGSNFRLKTNSLTEDLKAKGYIIGEEQGLTRKSFGSAQNQIAQLMEHLADTNPATKEFLSAISDIEQSKAYDFINQKRHTKEKKGIFGMEGRKTWENDYQNTKDLLTSQLMYVENAFRWAELSNAMQETKKILSSDIDQPNAKQWIESYTDNALGLNPTKWGQDFQKAFDSMLYSTGVGPSSFKSAAGTTRQAINTLLLSMNIPFWATQMYQPLASLPGMASWLSSKGIDTGVMGFGYFSKGTVSAVKFTMNSDKLNVLEKEAFAYAKKKAVYTADLIDTSTSPRKDTGYYFDKVGSFVAAPLEAATRVTTFMTYVHMLSESGITPKSGLYEAAHNLTDMAVVNYSKQERPQAFNALGTVGELGANLQSYKFNELSKLAMFARAAKEDKNLMPVLSQLLMYIVAAGVLGVPGFNELDTLYKQLTKSVGKTPKSLTEDVIKVSEKLSSTMNQGAPKELTLSPYLLSHGTFSQLGVDMSKRLGMGDLVPNTFMDAAFPGASRLYSILDSGAQVVRDPSEFNAKVLGRELLPNGMTGPVDREWFSKQTTEGEFGVNKTDPTKTGPVRTEQDKFWKTIGATGINESVNKQKLWGVEENSKAYLDMRQSAIKKMVKASFTQDSIQEHVQSYLDAQGDPKSLENELSQKLQAGSISAITAAKIKAGAAKSFPQIFKTKKLVEAYENQ